MIPTKLDVVMELNVAKERIAELEAELAECKIDAGKLVDEYTENYKKLLDVIGDIFHVGKEARTPDTIIANVRNAARRSACLSRIERHHVYTFEVDGEEYTDSRLHWGENPDDYIETYKAALEVKDEL